MDISKFIFIGLVLGICFISLSILNTYFRIKTKSFDSLIPNQLLTTYPIVLVKDKLSIFYPWNYWNHLTLFLREHGYEVIEIRKDQLESLSPDKAHFFYNISEEEQLLQFNERMPNKIASLNLLHSKDYKAQNASTKQNKILVRKDPGLKAGLLLNCQFFLNPFSAKDFTALGCFQNLAYYLVVLQHINQLAETDLRS